MFKKPVALIAVLLIGIGTSFAQGPFGPGRGGPGRFGFGPLGGPGMGGMAQSSVVLLGMPEVRAELKITESQQKSLDELTTQTQDKQRAAMRDFDPRDLFDLSEEERQKKLDEIRNINSEISRNADTALEKILDKSQSQRLGELRLQREGALALVRPEVAKKLQLDYEQQKVLKKIETDAGPQGNRGFRVPPDFGRMEQDRQKTQASLLAVLTSSQKAEWDSMLGKPFTFPQPQMGPGGPMGGERKLVVERFDKDGDHRLDKTERQAARTVLKAEGGPGGGRRGGPGGGGFGFGPPGGPQRENREPPEPGKRVSAADVRSYPDAKLYDPTVLRTLFLDFENDDWEAELSDFNRSDVEVPATLTVDGQKYPDVGVHFRGMSSNMSVPPGYKHSLNLSLDFVDDKQRLYGYKTLNLLNSHEDPSCMSTVLYSHIARQHIPAPQANFVKVVINGEYWGVYVNVQQFNKEFLDENYKTTKGNRWKVRGSPGGGGGLDYVGDDLDDYRRRYEIKSKDTDKAWKELVKLCKTLNDTPVDQLPTTIEPMLDVDQLLWFLALDVALINNDGYWVRASDYSIYQDDGGKFHIVPHDMNEAFRGGMMMGFGPGGGPPGRRGRPPEGGPPGDEPRARRGPGGGVELDPLVALDDARKPLRSKILAVPQYRTRYLQHVRTIADESLDWKNLGLVVAQFRSLIEGELKQDTRKLEPFDAFVRTTANEVEATERRGREMPLRQFADQRRSFLLNHAEIKKVSQ